MINPVGMTSYMQEFSGPSSAGLQILDSTFGSESAQADLDALILSPEYARSFSSQLLVEQISIRITARIETVSIAAEESMPQDFSAEATAVRIFEFSTSFFGVYQSQNPDESLESAMAGFEQLIRDAIDEGFGEARDVLDQLGRLDEQITGFVDEIFSVLDTLLDDFFANAEEAMTA